MKLTYWCAPCLNDSECYSIRAKTKREAVEMVKLYKASGGTRYGTIRKVTVEYASGFELLDQCLSEGRIFEGESFSTETVLTGC